jgi:hypothetical protein
MCEGENVKYQHHKNLGKVGKINISKSTASIALKRSIERTTTPAANL